MKDPLTVAMSKLPPPEAFVPKESVEIARTLDLIRRSRSACFESAKRCVDVAIKQAELDYAIAAKINFANSKMSAVEYRQRAFHSDNDQ